MIIYSYGFQSDQVQKAIQLLSAARRKKHRVILAFTGNMISSGLRGLIRQLCEFNRVDGIITNGAGIEEDLIKTFGSYESVEFDKSLNYFRKNELYRIGNLAVAQKLYEEFDKFLGEQYRNAISADCCDQTPGSIAKELGYLRGDTDSFLYWSKAKNIPVYCPTFHDGAFGDFFVNFREEFPDYRVDFLLENVKLTKQLMAYETCGVIILGGGTSKHFALNNSIKRGGYDWSITISTATPFDGSDSGGTAEEAKTWGKLKANGRAIHIYSEATLVFPAIVKCGFNIKV